MSVRCAAGTANLRSGPSPVLRDRRGGNCFLFLFIFIGYDLYHLRLLDRTERNNQIASDERDVVTYAARFGRLRVGAGVTWSSDRSSSEPSEPEMRLRLNNDWFLRSR